MSNFLLLAALFIGHDTESEAKIRIAMAMANYKPEKVEPRKEEKPNEHPERTLTLDWHGVDPPGWHRHGPDSKGEILTHRTHINPATGQSEGPIEAHTFPSGETIWKIYTGPLPPTIVPLDYPLIIRAKTKQVIPSFSNPFNQH